jgi:hypothetical protein
MSRTNPDKLLIFIELQHDTINLQLAENRPHGTYRPYPNEKYFIVSLGVCLPFRFGKASDRRIRAADRTGIGEQSLYRTEQPANSPEEPSHTEKEELTKRSL